MSEKPIHGIDEVRVHGSINSIYPFLREDTVGFTRAYARTVEGIQEPGRYFVETGPGDVLGVLLTYELGQDAFMTVEFDKNLGFEDEAKPVKRLMMGTQDQMVDITSLVPDDYQLSFYATGTMKVNTGLLGVGKKEVIVRAPKDGDKNGLAESFLYILGSIHNPHVRVWMETRFAAMFSGIGGFNEEVAEYVLQKEQYAINQAQKIADELKAKKNVELPHGKEGNLQSREALKGLLLNIIDSKGPEWMATAAKMGITTEAE